MEAALEAAAGRAQQIRLTVNGRPVALAVDPRERLSEALRHDLGLTGTKVGCSAGDCGACTVLVDGAQLCACLVACGQVEGRAVTTIEGLAGDADGRRLQQAFLDHGAAQCGICTPGMLMAATSLLKQVAAPTRDEVQDALGGVLCRCTGYQKIVEAVTAAAEGLAQEAPLTDPGAGAAVGARVVRVDGAAKVTGRELYGADKVPPGAPPGAPDDALWLRAVRSPHARARFTLGDLEAVVAKTPGLERILTAGDVPGSRCFGVYPHIKDQPVLAEGEVRYRGEAVLALVGTRQAVWSLSEADLPIDWQVEEPVADFCAEAARPVQAAHPDNVLARGFVNKGAAEAALAASPVTASTETATPFIEHAYIEPEAGYAVRRRDEMGGDAVEIWVTTQSPYMDRDETALILGLDKERVRIVPSACGGGFGGKLDLSVQPLVALAAWLLDRPVRCEYTRPESMAATTKRHASRVTARAGCERDGRLTALVFDGVFDTGAYASWGPTVADRVPVHCSGPYRVPNVLARSVGRFTNAPPAGAFRGFGVPQSALAHEALMDGLAAQLGLDPLEFRALNAIRAGDATATGQVLEASAGLPLCLDALRPLWKDWRAAAERFNEKGGRQRRGVGIGCVWYGCGNTSMSNPSTLALGIDRKGALTLYNGAVDIGQGSNTVTAQIAADALGVPVERLRVVMGDTGLTADAGKTSASRQTFISGKAAELAGRDLRQKILRLANAGEGARLELKDGRLLVHDRVAVRAIDLAELPQDARGDVLCGSGTFDPPTTKLDADGQGSPYATYGFAAQIAEVAVDLELGTVKVTRMAAAHDVGRAVNPTLVEGQIHGGIAQGLGLALMEEYLPGRTENLHDYLIPTFGDMPEITCILVEDPEPLGPYGAKGVGEHSLIGTAPAIFGGIEQATGVRPRETPATPSRVLALLREKGVP